MTNRQWSKVFALYRERVKKRKALWDIQPYHLTPSEFERLIVDSFYATIRMVPNASKEDVGYAQKVYRRLPFELKHTIEKHLAHIS